MKIATFTNQTPNFTSRKPEIRKADDLVRKVNLNVPALSTSYAHTFWNSLNIDKYPKNFKTFAKIAWPKINKCRDEFGKTNKNYENPIDILKATRKYKAGNCFEKSFLTLGALYANGFYDAIGTSVATKVKAIDKRTGKTVFKKNFLYDHCCIATGLSKQRQPNDIIIIDPWFNKAMSLSEAKEKYKTLIPEQEFLENIEKFKNKFIESNKKDYGIFGKKLPIDFNIKNYEFQSAVNFGTTPDCFQFEDITNRVKFGKLVKKEFPELVFK